MSEREIDVEQVREEHLREVNQAVQWAYLVLVLGGGTALMLIVLWLLELTS